MARVLRIDWKRLPSEWLLRSTLTLRTSQENRAVLQILATYVIFRLQRHKELKLNDYYDFFRRARWKLETRNNRTKLVGKLSQCHAGRRVSEGSRGCCEPRSGHECQPPQ